MTMPVRIQLSRRKGWHQPPNTMRCCRPTRFGNPYVHDDPAMAARAFGEMLNYDFSRVPGLRSAPGAKLTSRESVDTLRALIFKNLPGRNLGCWCKLCPVHAAGKPLDITCDDCAPCHVDAIGSLLANRTAALEESPAREPGAGKGGAAS